MEELLCFSMQNIMLSAVLVFCLLVGFLPFIQMHGWVSSGCSGCTTKRQKESYP